MAKKSPIIKCPHCGREYLAGEIYLPKSFVGQPTDVIKGFEGQVLTYNGTDMDLKEEFVCENCDTKFSVEATVSFKTKEVTDMFAEDDFEINPEV